MASRVVRSRSGCRDLPREVRQMEPCLTAAVLNAEARRLGAPRARRWARPVIATSSTRTLWRRSSFQETAKRESEEGAVTGPAGDVTATEFAGEAVAVVSRIDEKEAEIARQDLLQASAVSADSCGGALREPGVT